LSNDLRLLLDESVTDPLARAIQGISSVNVECVRGLSIKGASDDRVVDYARMREKETAL
jgi:hypothetical protein